MHNNSGVTSMFKISPNCQGPTKTSIKVQISNQIYHPLCPSHKQWYHDCYPHSNSSPCTQNSSPNPAALVGRLSILLIGFQHAAVPNNGGHATILMRKRAWWLHLALACPRGWAFLLLFASTVMGDCCGTLGWWIAAVQKSRMEIMGCLYDGPRVSYKGRGISALRRTVTCKESRYM